MIKFDDIYPLTIITDRYYGTYSGANYLAFNLDYDEIPQEINASDIDCYNFWLDNKDMVVGKGASIIEAIVDLMFKIDKERKKDEEIE